MLEAQSETTGVAALKQIVYQSEKQWLKWKAGKCANYELAQDKTI